MTDPASPSARTCRWIDGDVRDPGWRYCGRPTVAGRSWCAEHNARAYRQHATNKGASRILVEQDADKVGFSGRAYPRRSRWCHSVWSSLAPLRQAR
jgi:hypothetical protein